MVEVIDLTLSDDKQVDLRSAPEASNACYTTLPLRSRQRLPPPRSGKRARDDTLCPTIQFLSPKRTRSDKATHSVQYPQGVVRPVHVLHHNRPDDVTLPDVLDISNLKQAVVSSLRWDVYWLLNTIGLRLVDTTFIADNTGSDKYTLQVSRAPRGTPGTLRWHFPPRRSGAGCHHSKLMLLFRKDDTLRLAIPTGNLRRADWGALPPTCRELLKDTPASIDNTIFMVDLPLRQQGNEEEINPFKRELMDYLSAIKLPLDIRSQVAAHSFAACSQFKFIWSRYVSNSPKILLY